MRKFLLFILFAGVVNAQSKSEKFQERSFKHAKITFEQTQNFNEYSKISNGRVFEYVTSAGLSLKVGDTLTLGLPYGGGDHLRGGNNNNTAAERKFNAGASGMVYTQILAGDPYNGGAIALKALAAYGGASVEDLQNGPLRGNFNGETFVVKRIRVYRLQGGKKKKPYIGIAVQPINGALGINKNAFVSDYEAAFQIGELIDPEMASMFTVDQARAELRILKEDFELGLYTQEEFDAKKKEIQAKIRKK